MICLALNLNINVVLQLYEKNKVLLIDFYGSFKNFSFIQKCIASIENVSLRLKMYGWL